MFVFVPLDDFSLIKKISQLVLFVCLEFFVPTENCFHSFRDVTIASEGLQFVIYTLHTDLHTLCLAFGSRSVITCFNDLGPLRLEFEHQTFPMRGERSNPMHHRRVEMPT